LLDDNDDSFRISKEVLPSLEGLDFVETIMGDPDGSLRQYRNSTGMHIREFEEYFEVHKDQVDPRVNPLGHLIRDSPETLAAFGTASLLTRSSTGKESTYGSPLDFLSLFFFLNRFFRVLKKLLF
jgi:hypothetical protein